MSLTQQPGRTHGAGRTDGVPMNPFGQGPGGRPLTAADVRSVVFSTTRMRLGYDVEEVDAFLDQIEWTLTQSAGEIQALRNQAAASAQAVAAATAAETRLRDLRAGLQQLLRRLDGGPAAAGYGAQPPTPSAPMPGQMPFRGGHASPVSPFDSPVPPPSRPSRAAGQAPYGSLAAAPPPTGAPVQIPLPPPR